MKNELMTNTHNSASHKIENKLQRCAIQMQCNCDVYVHTEIKIKNGLKYSFEQPHFMIIINSQQPISGSLKNNLSGHNIKHYDF